MTTISFIKALFYHPTQRSKKLRKEKHKCAYTRRTGHRDIKTIFIEGTMGIKNRLFTYPLFHDYRQFHKHPFLSPNTEIQKIKKRKL